VGTLFETQFKFISKYISSKKIKLQYVKMQYVWMRSMKDHIISSIICSKVTIQIANTNTE